MKTKSNPDNQNFAKLIRDYMKSSALTLTALACKLETSPQNIKRQLENNNFTEAQMQRYAAALGLDLVLSLGDDQPAPVPVPAVPDYIPSYSHRQAQIWIKALQDGRSICPPTSPIRSRYDDLISDLIAGRVPDTFKQPFEEDA